MRYEISIEKKPVYFERCRTKWEALARVAEAFEVDGVRLFALTIGDEIQAQITRGRERTILSIRPEREHTINAHVRAAA
jgi:hypothetical protein